MPLAFFINNLHFALELMGATVFFMAAWLTFDAYKLRKNTPMFLRAVGLGLYAVWEVLSAVSVGSDVASYIGFVLCIVGLACILGSFFTTEKLQMQSILVLPAFAQWSGALHGITSVLLFGIAYASYRQWKRNLNKTWIPFSLTFAFLGLGAFFTIFSQVAADIPFDAGAVCEAAAFVFLAGWVWQYLQLRIRESLTLIFISGALFLSTIVTLAFSTILINQITQETDANLHTDVRVLGLNIAGLQAQALAQAALIAGNNALATAVTKNDFVSLEQNAETLMQTYNLGFLTVTDAQGNVLVRANALSKRGDSLAGERAFEEAAQGTVFVTIENSPVEKLSVRAGAPLMQNGKLVGAVIAGYPLDNAFLDNMQRLTGLDMFIYQDNQSVASSAFGADGVTRLTGLSIPQGQADQVLQQGQTITTRVTLGGEPFEASFLPLQNGDAKTIGMLSAAKPEQDILDLENSTNRLTLITVVVTMLVLLLPMYLLTKRLTEQG